MDTERSVERAGISRRALVAAGLGVVGLGTAGPLAFALTTWSNADNTFPQGTVVDGVDVAGLTPEQAVAALDDRWATYLASPVVFDLNGRLWRPTAADIGLRVDYIGALRAAHLGRPTGGLARRIARPDEAAVGVPPPVATYDPERLRTYLSNVAAAFDQPAIDARVDVSPSGAIRLHPGQSGRVVDIESAVRVVGDPSIPSEPGRVVRLGFRADEPRLATARAEEAAERLNRLVSGPLHLMHGARGWILQPSELREAVRIEVADDAFVTGLELTRFNDLFQSIDATLSADPSETVFEYDEASDRVTAFKPGNSGQRVDRPGLETAILEGAARTDDRRVEVPLILLNREYDLAANPLGIKDLLATGSSIYRGSPDYRDHNIAVGAAKLDGQVVRPGETFSFNERIGPLTLAAGWVEGSIIIEDKTERGIGGGICQLSTTLFRAALSAGLPIEERWPHLYRVRYYEMGDVPIGVDATVFIPGVDLKFGNNFDHPVMLRTRIDPRLSTLDFEIWGVDDGRTVELVDHKLINWTDPPPDQGIVNHTEEPDFEDQVEWSKKGVQAQITRVIRRPQSDQARSTFRSSYVAWPNRFVVGIDVAKARFARAYNEWFEENPEEAARWGVGRVPGVPSEKDAPFG